MRKGEQIKGYLNETLYFSIALQAAVAVHTRFVCIWSSTYPPQTWIGSLGHQA